jgi:hypothetical protein
MEMTSHTVAEVITALGGPSAVARIIGKGQSTVGEMKRSGRIGVEYWPAIIEAAQAAGFDWVTSDELMRIHARRAQAEAEVAR